MAIDPQTLAAILGTGGANTTGSSDINAFERTLSGNDPYRTAAAPILGTKLNLNNSSMGSALGATAAQAFVGSILNEIGKHSEGDQLAAVGNILPQLYANPSSVSAPSGVDPEAFGGLKLAAMERQAQTNESIRKSLGDKYIGLNPDGSVSALPGIANAVSTIFAAENNAKKPPLNLAGTSPQLQKALIDSGGDMVLARQLLKTQLASQPTLQGLSNSIATIKNLEDLKQQAASQTEASALPDFFQGGINTLAAGVNQGSAPGIYNSHVHGVADSLLRALTQVGRGSQYTQQQITNDLSNGYGKGPEALAKIIRQYQQELLTGAQQRASDLVQGGYSGTNPVLDQIQNLDLNNMSSVNSAAPDIASFIAQAKAQGLSKEDAKAKWLQLGGQ